MKINLRPPFFSFAAQNYESKPVPEFAVSGHFYSPIPGSEDILRRKVMLQEPTGIDLNADAQAQLLQALHKFYPEMPFSDQAVENGRFSFTQNYFCHSNAIYLYSLIRHYKPKSFIEIGFGGIVRLWLWIRRSFFWIARWNSLLSNPTRFGLRLT